MATLSHTTNPDRFHNMPPGMLADQIGKLDREAKAAAAELEAAKDAFKARGLLIAEGTAFAVMIQKSIRQTLDTAALKAAMGQPWFDDHSKLAEVMSMRITASNALAVAA